MVPAGFDLLQFDGLSGFDWRSDIAIDAVTVVTTSTTTTTTATTVTTTTLPPTTTGQMRVGVDVSWKLKECRQACLSFSSSLCAISVSFCDLVNHPATHRPWPVMFLLITLLAKSRKWNWARSKSTSDFFTLPRQFPCYLKRSMPNVNCCDAFCKISLSFASTLFACFVGPWHLKEVSITLGKWWNTSQRIEQSAGGGWTTNSHKWVWVEKV